MDVVSWVITISGFIVMLEGTSHIGYEQNNVLGFLTMCFGFFCILAGYLYNV